MNLGDGHFAEDFENFTSYSSDSDDEDSGVKKRGWVSVDEFEEFMSEGDWIFHHGL